MFLEVGRKPLFQKYAAHERRDGMERNHRGGRSVNDFAMFRVGGEQISIGDAVGVTRQEQQSHTKTVPIEDPGDTTDDLGERLIAA